MVIESSKEKGLKAFLTLLFPMGAFIYSWKSLNTRSSYWVILIFCLLYGLSFRAYVDAADSARYVEEFRIFIANPSYNFSSIFSEFFSPDSEIKDIFVYALYYLTYLLAGDNYHVFFFLVSIVFSTFFLLSLKFITDDTYFKNNFFCFFLVCICVLSNPIFNINGVRFWTATWIAVWASFNVIINNKRIYILALFFLPLIHGAYYVYIVFFLFAYFAKSWHKVLPYLFFISFFFTDVALMILPDFTGYLPPFLQNMIWSYTESDYALSRMSGAIAKQEALYARILMAIPKYYQLILIFLIVRSRRLFQDKKSLVVMGFMLAIGAAINFSSLIPSIKRFWQILIPFVVYLWIHNRDVMYRYKEIIFLYPLVALYPTFRLLRNIVWTTDPLLFISNSFHIVIHSLLVVD